jgi:hypothetical protein
MGVFCATNGRLLASADRIRRHKTDDAHSQVPPPKIPGEQELNFGSQLIFAQYWQRGISVPLRCARLVNQVPLGRYFLFVGSVLLAMLFMAERHLADSTAQLFMREARVDKSIIRLQSAHKWPEPVVFNTNLPTIVPPAPPILANAPALNQPREALAQLIEPSRPVAKHSEPKKAKRKLASGPRPARMAAYRPDMMAGYRPDMPPAAW